MFVSTSVALCYVQQSHLRSFEVRVQLNHSVKAALEAVQLHGAYGYSDEYNVERYLRNSKGAVIYEGTSEIHQLMQAAYQFGTRRDRPLRRELPAYDEEAWLEEPRG